MLRLMKLEWKKHQLSSYFKSVAICIIAIFAVVSLMALGMKAEGTCSSLTSNRTWI